MSIDPRITMGIRVPDAGSVIGTFNKNMQNNAEQKRIAELQPFKLQEAQQITDINQLKIDAGNAQANDAVTQRKLKSINDFAIGNQSIINDAVNTGDPTQLQGALVKRREQMIQQGLPTDETDEAITILGQGNIQGVVSGLSDSVKLYNQQKGKTTGQRDFDSSTQGFSEEDRIKARRIELGLDPRASLSASERIAQDEVLGQQVVAQKTAEATGSESGKSAAQLKFKPQITKAVKLAEKAATEQGEVLTDLARAEAGLPGLLEATGNLKELADVATSTYGGRFFDLIAKESGWGSTKGANARAKYIAIIDNQVLPLLKQTFGAAMTEGEGLRLSNTLGDANASPEQKILQTDAFIEQKKRDIERLKAQSVAGEDQSEAAIFAKYGVEQ